MNARVRIRTCQFPIQGSFTKHLSVDISNPEDTPMGTYHSHLHRYSESTECSILCAIPMCLVHTSTLAVLITYFTGVLIVGEEILGRGLYGLINVNRAGRERLKPHVQGFPGVVTAVCSTQLCNKRTFPFIRCRPQVQPSQLETLQDELRQWNVNCIYSII